MGNKEIIEKGNLRKIVNVKCNVQRKSNSGWCEEGIAILVTKVCQCLQNVLMFFFDNFEI